VRRAVLPAAAAALALALAAPAPAAAQTVQAIDGTAADNYNNRWTPRDLTVRAGEAVTWTFAGTSGPHNVVSNTPNWSFSNGRAAVGLPPASFTFANPGIYAFVCELHRQTMEGTVTVTDAAGNAPPPPPPPPLSEQAWPNEQPAPTVLEVRDSQRPRLTRVRVSRIARGARVRFRVSEAARVTIAVKRGSRTVKTKRARARRGAQAVTVRGLPAGRYRFAVRARDLSGNRSARRWARLTIRG
jgi:plastocyanin